MSVRLILGSTSIYRRELLARLHIPFEVMAPGTVEDPLPHESAAQLALRLAQAKARDVARLLQPPFTSPVWVIGSDQAAVRPRDGGGLDLIGKPGTHEAAVRQLLASSGKTLTFNTAVCLHECGTGREQIANVAVVARYRQLNVEQIERYLAKEPAYDCAGAAKSEGLGISLLESCQSDDPTALVGLPLITVASMLRAWGMDLP
jgi:septum formation protein